MIKTKWILVALLFSVSTLGQQMFAQVEEDPSMKIYEAIGQVRETIGSRPPILAKLYLGQLIEAWRGLNPGGRVLVSNEMLGFEPVRTTNSILGAWHIQMVGMSQAALKNIADNSARYAETAKKILARRAASAARESGAMERASRPSDDTAGKTTVNTQSGNALSVDTAGDSGGLDTGGGKAAR